MSNICETSRPADAKQAFGNDRGSGARAAADWLCFAATPTFAILALLTALGGSEPEILCAAIQHRSPLSGTCACGDARGRGFRGGLDRRSPGIPPRVALVSEWSFCYVTIRLHIGNRLVTQSQAPHVGQFHVRFGSRLCKNEKN